MNAKKAKTNDNQRFLQHRVTKCIFPYTDIEAKNPKFIVCTKNGIAIGSGIEAGDMNKSIEALEQTIIQKDREISNLSVYVMELEAKVMSGRSRKTEREQELIHMGRKPLMEAALLAGIDSAPQKFHKGKEPDLVIAILALEFSEPDKE